MNSPSRTSSVTSSTAGAPPLLYVLRHGVDADAQLRPPTRSRPSTREPDGSRGDRPVPRRPPARPGPGGQGPRACATRAGHLATRRAARPRARTPSSCRLRTASIIVSARAGELALGPAHDAVLGLDPPPAEHELAVAHARRRRGVGDEREPRRGRVPGHQHRVRRDVVQVDDDLHDDVGPRQRGEGDARVARRSTGASALKRWVTVGRRGRRRDGPRRRSRRCGRRRP